MLDQGEVEKFDALAETWWRSDGPMAPLHAINPIRLGYLRDQAMRQLGREQGGLRPLEGLRMLDVGCGCGLVAEPARRMGAEVTAIDPSERNIEVARRHAGESGLEINYRAVTTDQLIDAETIGGSSARFDLLTCFEVIEHTSAGDELVFDLAELTRPGGLLVMSTLNRTAQSFVKAIIGAEYVLGWLPRGTHDWRRFVPPSALARWLRRAGFRVIDVTGVTYDFRNERFALSADRSVNYMLAALRTGG